MKCRDNEKVKERHRKTLKPRWKDRGRGSQGFDVVRQTCLFYGLGPDTYGTVVYWKWVRVGSRIGSKSVLSTYETSNLSRVETKLGTLEGIFEVF